MILHDDISWSALCSLLDLWNITERGGNSIPWKFVYGAEGLSSTPKLLGKIFCTTVALRVTVNIEE